MIKFIMVFFNFEYHWLPLGYNQDKLFEFWLAHGPFYEIDNTEIYLRPLGP